MMTTTDTPAITKYGRELTETEISASIGEYLNKRGIYNLRLNSGKTKKNGSWIQLCPAGTPDRLSVINGKLVFWEIKRPNEKPTTAQIEMHARIATAGGIVFVVTSLDEAIAAIKEIEK